MVTTTPISSTRSQKEGCPSPSSSRGQHSHLSTSVNGDCTAYSPDYNHDQRVVASNTASMTSMAGASSKGITLCTFRSDSRVRLSRIVSACLLWPHGYRFQSGGHAQSRRLQCQLERCRCQHTLTSWCYYYLCLHNPVADMVYSCAQWANC
jgi:hypothetical protein